MRPWSAYLFIVSVSIALAQNDPFERVNRAIYTFNYFIDSSLFRPIAKTYRRTPEWIRERVSNFVSNISSPVRILAFVLSGDLQNAASESAAFALNSTAGLLGFLDPASDIGLQTPETDLDLAIKSWGIDSGPFIMLPVIGPSCLRAIVPLAVTNFVSFDYWIIRNGNSTGYLLATIESLDKRSNLEPLIENAEKMSFDTYTFIRNFYLSKRSISSTSEEEEF